MRCGCCRHPEAATIAGGALTPAVFPALVGLFIHPQEGPVLFDTGYDPAFIEATRGFPERLYRWLTPPELAPGECAAEQLRKFNIEPSDVRLVVLSHFHGDHVAGLHAFARARIACSRRGLATARVGVWGSLTRGVLPALLPADIEDRLVFFEDRPPVGLPTAYAPFARGADLIGDGSLIAVELPGHCPGHWGMAARGQDDRLHFLVGDAAWSSRAIRENRPPPRLTTAMLGRTAVYRETLSGLHCVAASAPELLITPAHCAERAAEIEAAP
jgi:glyoxylase-like metal-dependent hydrolase (beta-lactamase superfamily II)